MICSSVKRLPFIVRLLFQATDSTSFRRSFRGAGHLFKGSGQGFVEVVDIEDEVSLGRGEASEIHQMTVAAGMHIYSASRRTCEIVRLDQGRTSKIRKGRLEHSSMANRDQILHSVFV